MCPPTRRPAALWVYNILDGNLVDMHGQAVGYRLSGKPDVPVARQTWNYMVEHLYCMIITIIVFICSCFALLGLDFVDHTFHVWLHSRFLDTFI